MARDNVQLLIIDPQNDFCDLPQEYCPSGGGLRPALPVAGAHADMQRLVALIDAGCDGLSGIVVTLDSHQHLDIAHPTFWCTVSADAVAPFSAIAAADVRAGRVLPRLTQARERVLAYLDALEAAGRYRHMVWPVHCEIGTWGHNIHHDLRLACNRWEERHVAIVSKVLKGRPNLTIGTMARIAAGLGCAFHPTLCPIEGFKKGKNATRRSRVEDTTR